MAKRAKSLARGLARNSKIDRTSINPEDRTVELAFSSEEPVERWGENEVLSHNKGDYDFDRLNNDHPLLLGHAEHDPNSQIGVIQSARVDKDKIGRAVVRFGNSDKAKEIFQDVQDGIRKLVSVGYDRTGIVESKKSSNGMMTTRYRWTPTHIAIVPVPADTKVGVGRQNRYEGDPPDDNPPAGDVPDYSGSAPCPRCGHANEIDADGDMDGDKTITCAHCNHEYEYDPSPILDADGDGVKSKQVDSSKQTNVEHIAKNLTTEQKERMRILLDHAPADGGGVKIEEVRAKVKAEIANRKKELRTRADAIVKDFPLAADKVRSMVEEAADTDEAISEVSYRMLKEAGAVKPLPNPLTMTELGMNQREQGEYSILRGIQSSINRDFGKPDGLEGEVHRAMVAKNLGVPYTGFLAPMDAPVRTRKKRGQRDMQVNIFGQGGATVATQLMTPVIEILRNRMVCDRLGVEPLSGLVGNVAIPRQTGAGTAYAVSEIAGLTLSNQQLDQIPLIPKRVGAYAQYSKQLLLQSSIDIENFIRDDLLKVIAIAWDRLILNGSGANSEPLGIMQTPGVGAVTFGGAATYTNLVSFHTAVASANADVGDMAYVTTPTAEGKLRSNAKLLGGATTVAAYALWEGPFGPDSPDGIVAGYRAASTNQIPNNQMVFGVFSQVLHALWGGYDVVVNPYSLDTSAEVRITINTFGDVAIRHPQCFAVSSDSAAQ